MLEEGSCLGWCANWTLIWASLGGLANDLKITVSISVKPFSLLPPLLLALVWSTDPPSILCPKAAQLCPAGSPAYTMRHTQRQLDSMHSQRSWGHKHSQPLSTWTPPGTRAVIGWHMEVLYTSVWQEKRPLWLTAHLRLHNTKGRLDIDTDAFRYSKPGEYMH